mmetsp:Transcript_7325/g.22560  ORF Transcript_7325/g.22560 Transcript_7325/m.22560 type:complete len:481 (-) Transcript_7325:287-1729(-)
MEPPRAPLLTLEARDVSFEYPSTKDFSVSCASVELRSGRVLALMGFNGAGKSTLCRMLGRVDVPLSPAPVPTRGRVFYYPRGTFDRVDPHREPYAATTVLSTVLAAALYFLFYNNNRDDSFEPVFVFLVVVLFSAVHFMLRRVKLWWFRRRVVYVSTEHDLAARQLDDRWTLAFAITSHLRLALSRKERDALAERLLAWSGFRYAKNTPEERAPRYADAAQVIQENTLTCGELSGGQRHLVYVLRALAPAFAPKRRFVPRIDVLLLDEALNCLDADVRPRTMRLIKYAVKTQGIACLVVTQILHEICALCEDCAFVDDGSVVETGAVKDLVPRDATPAHPRFQTYVRAAWDLERDMHAASSTERNGEASSKPCGAELSAAMNALPELLFLGLPWDTQDPRRGDIVQIRGLQAQQRFNGKEAVVLGRLDAFRFKVRASKQTLAVRHANLVFLRRCAPGDAPPPEDAPKKQHHHSEKKPKGD